MAKLEELREVIALCRDNNVLQVKFGDIELAFLMNDPQAEKLQEIADATLGTPETPGDPYDDPALYPGGEDPVKSLREWKKKLAEQEKDRAKLPSTGQ